MLLLPCRLEHPPHPLPHRGAHLLALVRHLLTEEPLLLLSSTTVTRDRYTPGSGLQPCDRRFGGDQCPPHIVTVTLPATNLTWCRLSASSMSILCWSTTRWISGSSPLTVTMAVANIRHVY
jgi:hypothetical protein